MHALNASDLEQIWPNDPSTVSLSSHLAVFLSFWFVLISSVDKTSSHSVHLVQVTVLDMHVLADAQHSGRIRTLSFSPQSLVFSMTSRRRGAFARARLFAVLRIPVT